MESHQLAITSLEKLDYWKFLNEGNNNVIFRYIGDNDFLSQKVLRVRKTTN